MPAAYVGSTVQVSEAGADAVMLWLLVCHWDFGHADTAVSIPHGTINDHCDCSSTCTLWPCQGAMRCRPAKVAPTCDLAASRQVTGALINRPAVCCHGAAPDGGEGHDLLNLIPCIMGPSILSCLQTWWSPR